MSLSINTNSYIKGHKFEIDGNVWEYRAPGAGVTLQLSKASRKSEIIQAKIDKGTASEGDLVEQAELVELVFDFYESVLRDSTKNNTQVKAWLKNTPMDVIAAIVQDIQKASGN